MKGINTLGQALDSGGVASFSAPRDGVSHLAFPALAPERNLPADPFPLAPLGNKTGRQPNRSAFPTKTNHLLSTLFLGNQKELFPIISLFFGNSLQGCKRSITHLGVRERNQSPRVFRFSQSKYKIVGGKESEKPDFQMTKRIASFCRNQDLFKAVLGAINYIPIS